MKTKIAIVRGKFLNKFEMQSFEPLYTKFDITAFGSLTPFQDSFVFPTVKLLSPMDIPEIPLKMQIINRLFVDAHYLYGLEEKLKGFDIAHSAETYYRYTQQCLNAKKRGYVKKVAVTILENIPFNNEGIWGRRTFKQRTRSEADILIALTERTKATLIAEGADEKKIVIIGSGINTERFEPGKRQQKEFILKNRNINLLFVGRLEKYKGVYELLHAFHALKKDKELSKYSLNLTMVGNGNEKESLLRLEQKLGIAESITHNESSYDEIHKVYQAADMFIAPSYDIPTWNEQFGYMLLESQATGLPIITTDGGSIPEVVGNAAIIVEQKQDIPLYKEIKKLLLQPEVRITLGKKARARAVQVHDYRKKAEQLEKVYNALL